MSDPAGVGLVVIMALLIVGIMVAVFLGSWKDLEDRDE